MPEDPSRPPQRRVSRRAVVLWGATAPLVACSALDAEQEATAPPPPHPDEEVRERAVTAESELIALYSAAAAEHPGLAEQLDPFRRRHERHRAALADAAVPAPATTRTPGATASPAPDAPLPPVPADPGEMLEELETAEAEATEARLADCLDAAGSELATVLASVAAGEAAHGRLLRRVEAP